MTLTDGTNHPSMSKLEGIVRRHVEKGNAVLMEVIPNYHGGSLVPHSITMFAFDARGNILVNQTVTDGLRQITQCCRD